MAVLFLQAIALDLADASCDPILAPGTGTAFSTADDGAEPCAGLCVSDCFCCSPSMTDDDDWTLTELDPRDRAGAPPSARLAEGVPLLPDRPPRLRAS